MNIKVLHIALSHGGGGVEVYLRSLIKMTTPYIENVVVCSSDFTVEGFDEGIKVYYEDVPREIDIKADLLASKHIRNIINAEKPDIVYCHSSMAGVIGRCASICKKVKVIYNPHGWNFDIISSGKITAVFYAMVERILSHFTDKIVSISDYERNIAIKKHICKKDKLTVIKNGIEIKDYDLVAKTNQESCVIGCCARISEQKDPLLFADVMGIVAKKLPKARFVWIGDGYMKDKLLNSLENNNIKNLTEITGWVKNPHSYIAKTDMGVLLSAWEGFGLSILDFLIMGKPVVCTNVGGMPEIVDDNVGKVVSCREPQKIADAIIEVYEKNKNKAFFNYCKNRAKAFDLKFVSDKTLKLYNDLMKV